MLNFEIKDQDLEAAGMAARFEYLKWLKQYPGIDEVRFAKITSRNPINFDRLPIYDVSTTERCMKNQCIKQTNLGLVFGEAALEALIGLTQKNF